jgi:integrase
MTLLGDAWLESPLGGNLVFRTPLGTAVDPDNFRNATYRLTTRALGERWSPHELRHSAASLLIAQGVDLKIISEVLGHSSIRITADVYGHLLDDAGVVAADAMSDLFG